jgi:hypothetical protein
MLTGRERPGGIAMAHKSHYKENSMKRILMFSLVLALLVAMIISSAAFAQGDGDGSRARQGATYQNGATNGAGDGTGPILKCWDLNGDGVCGRP